MKIDFTKILTKEEVEFISTLNKEELLKFKEECESIIVLCDTNQQNRKILCNAIFGCLGAPSFRYYDLRNAEAITKMGQLCLLWTQNKLNEYLNSVCDTKGIDYILYGDTDSLYCSLNNLIDKIGVERFGNDTQKLINFIDKFCEQKVQPVLNSSSQELAEYFNNVENLLNFDREAIACAPLGTEGLGGVFKVKKRYALNVYDMEGVRYHEPHLKIMGLETRSSSTPSALREYLYDCIKVMLQEGEVNLQKFFQELKTKYESLDYLQITPVKSANGIGKWSDANGYPLSRCPNHIKGVLAYRRATNGFDGIPMISDGDKVMILPLRDGNPFGEVCMAWQANTKLPPEIANDVLVWYDKKVLFDKTFVKPLGDLCTAAGIQFEKKASLSDMFDFF